MKFALCNEMFGDRAFADTFSTIRKLGYSGVEIAPFTFAPGDEAFDVRRVPAEGYPIPRKPNVAALDAAKLHWPLTIRAWAPGDWPVPLGMRGKQKVSDLLVNQKVPANLKDRVLVLVNGNGSLAWVIGHRPDDRFKVTDATEEVVEVSVV